MPISAAFRARAVAALAVAGLLALTACGGGDGDAPTVSGDSGATVTTVAGATTTVASGAVVAVTFRGGSVVDGASRQRATLNQPVTVRVTSDLADEVHVHGYDKHVDVAAGRTAEVTFVANIPGVFEVELEKAKKVLFTLEVR
jgi:hypothetical protein